MTLTMALFHQGEPVSLGTGAHKWNKTIINFINYACVFLPPYVMMPAVTATYTIQVINGGSLKYIKTKGSKRSSNHALVFPIRHFHTETLFCDCQLKWLLLWARTNSVRIGNDTVCVFPTHLHGLEFRNLREQQLRCGKDCNGVNLM